MADHTSEPDLRLELLSQARFLAAVRTMIGNLAQRLGFNEIESGQISLAVDEALCNVINHGYDKRPDGRIWLNIWTIDDDERSSIKIVIEDRAKQVDPQCIRSRDLEDIRPGGLGVYIIREVMQDVRYEKREDAGGGMRLTMIKRRTAANVEPPPSSAASAVPSSTTASTQQTSAIAPATKTSCEKSKGTRTP